MNGVDSDSNARFSLIWRAIVFVLAGAFVWLACFRMLAVGVNPDEGFYLFCSRLVADGWMPFRDFGVTQPPFFLWIGSVFLPFFGWSLTGIRLLNVALIVIALVLALIRLVRSRRTLSVFLLWIMGIASPGWIDASVVGRPHALGGLILVLTVLTVSSDRPLGTRWFVFTALAVVGCLTRFTLFPFFLFCFGMLLFEIRGWRLRLLAVSGGVAFAGIVAFSVSGGAWDSFYFWTVDYHLLRELPTREGGRIPVYMHMLDAWRHAPVVWMGLVVGLFLPRIDPKIRILAVGLVVAVLLNVSTYRSYGDYVTPFVSPSILIVSLFLNPIQSGFFGNWRSLVGLFVAAACLIATGWIFRPYMWKKNDSGYIDELKGVTDFVTSALPVDSQVVSSVPEVVVGSQMRMPLKLSMGRFSVSQSVSPDWAERLHICTPNELIQFLKDDATKAFVGSTGAFDNFRLSIPDLNFMSDSFRNEFRSTLESRYVLVYQNSHYIVYLKIPIPEEQKRSP